MLVTMVLIPVRSKTLAHFIGIVLYEPLVDNNVGTTHKIYDK